MNRKNRGKEKLTVGTWGPLLRLLKDAGMSPEQCFFTNAFMGLCADDDNRKYRGRNDEAFRGACLLFLKQQIHIQRPRFILTLGRHVPPLLAQASTNLEEWKSRRLRLKDIDEVPIRFGAEFDMGKGSLHRAVVAALAHPSYPNNRTRTPKAFSPGRMGEIELIRAGWEQSKGGV